MWRPWTVAWLGGAVIGIVNGTARELGYGRVLPAMAAHQLSAAVAIGLFGGYFWWLDQRWPLPSMRTALEVGALWVSLTIVFEFGFGRYVDRNTWAELLRQYDVSQGYVWSLVLVWLGLGPAVVRSMRRGH